MAPPLDLIECACLPAPTLAALADLRNDPGVTVTIDQDCAWLRWDPASSSVLDRIRPIAGVELYTRRHGLWHRLGHYLPTFDVPVDTEPGVPLHRVLAPLPVSPEPPGILTFEPVGLTLVPDDTPRPATAVDCGIDELGRWAEMAPTARLACLRGARSGERMLVRGVPLPPLAGGRRFWGQTVLVPLGFRPEPALPESALREAVGVGGDEWIVLADTGFEVVQVEAFRPLTRAGIRLAREGRTP